MWNVYSRWRNGVKGERSRRLILGLRGISTAVDIQGNGPALLFVHGFPMDRTLWHHQMAAMRVSKMLRAVNP